MRRAYAQATKVSVEQTRMEIESLVKREGATKFGYYDDEEKAVIQFLACDRMIRFTLPIPTEGRSIEQLKRARWRALLLAIRAKYEAIHSGITEFETEFLPHVVVGNDRTVADEVRPAIDALYKLGVQSRGPLRVEFNPTGGR